MTSRYRFGDLPYDHRGPGDRGSGLSDSTYPQFSSYFGPCTQDTNMPSLNAPGPTSGPVGSRLTEPRDLPSSFAPVAARSSIPAQTSFFIAKRASTPYDNNQFFDLPASGFEPGLTQLSSASPSTAPYGENISSQSNTIPHTLRPLTLGNRLRKQDQILEPLVNRTGREEEVFSEWTGFSSVLSLITHYVCHHICTCRGPR